MNITNDTPVTFLTVGQLKEILREDQTTASKQVEPSKLKNYVYGLRGIQKLINCSQPTAQKLKNGILKEAVSQRGRKIVVDSDLAMELFKQHKENR